MDLPTFAFLLISFGVAPAIFYLWFFDRRDKWKREPLRLVLTIFLFGLVAVVPAAIIELFTAGIVATLVIGAPVVEESLKWGVVRWRAYNRKEFNEPLDGLVYGAAAALGFASLENVSYLFSPLISGGVSSEFLSTAIVRGLFSVPQHAIYTGISCFCLGVAKFMPNGLKRYGVILGGLGIAMALHATWNGVITGLIPDNFGEGVTVVAMIVFAAVCWAICANLIHIGLNRSPFNPTRRAPLPSAVVGARISKAVSRSSSAARPAVARFCPRCDAPLVGITRFCPKCGTQLSDETEAQGDVSKSIEKD